MKRYLLVIVCTVMLISGCVTLKAVYEKGKEHCKIDVITKEITCKV